jgi:hypothetical protein
MILYYSFSLCLNVKRNTTHINFTWPIILIKNLTPIGLHKPSCEKTVFKFIKHTFYEIKTKWYESAIIHFESIALGNKNTFYSV